MNGLYERDAAAEMIRAGRRLLLAGDEALLATLPQGDWIGGTIPYFMAAEGGVQTTERVFVTEFPEAAGATIRSYDAVSLPGLASDHPGHGFTVLLLPGFSAVHTEFAERVAHYPGVFDRPLVGWVSGVAVQDIGTVRPKVFNGLSGTCSADHAVALHVELRPEDLASVEIINLFRPADKDSISFPKAGFTVTDAVVNGETVNLARYLTQRGSDTKLPLIADYNGALVNVCIQNVDLEAGTVAFYASVFPGIDYRMAAPIDDYVASFAAHLDAGSPEPAFSCNCILNYLYAGLEGRSTAPLTGPVTFGEIAYMLLNQTAVYLTINRGE